MRKHGRFRLTPPAPYGLELFGWPDRDRPGRRKPEPPQAAPAGHDCGVISVSSS